jgi:hypothetical protein
MDMPFGAEISQVSSYTMRWWNSLHATIKQKNSQAKV